MSDKAKIKDSVQKVNGKRTSSNRENGRITQLLRIGENNDYPPSPYFCDENYRAVGSE